MPTTKIDEGLLIRIPQSSNIYDVSTIILVYHELKNGGMIDVVNVGGLEVILDKMKLHFEPFKEERQANYFIWYDGSFVPETQEARQAMYRELSAGNRTQTGARFLSVPDCCNHAWDKERSYEHYWGQLSELFRANGIEAIEPFVGIKHAPCTISCKPTLNLGYSSFLRKNYPNVYHSELIGLRDNAKI